MSYEKIKEYYDNGFWNKKQGHKAVEVGKMTAEQYKEITGEEYVG